jgi:hypothetical protein
MMYEVVPRNVTLNLRKSGLGMMIRSALEGAATSGVASPFVEILFRFVAVAISHVSMKTARHRRGDVQGQSAPMAGQ